MLFGIASLLPGQSLELSMGPVEGTAGGGTSSTTDESSVHRKSGSPVPDSISGEQKKIGIELKTIYCILGHRL